ncbi:S41 family peptidase [Halosquirtibacter xylanolyticus]|uniref:S41 family peptidase n=1 Tax=Halosquirtibacter xylanolyticus TaxID=3374599 RepID=UPI003749DEE9|nr:S41 family peptidase [Prolixibacteraceae bacterium]
MKKKYTKIVVSFVILGTLMVGLLSFNRDSKNFTIAKNLDIYYSLFRELNLFYVDSISPDKIVKTSIDKMLETLDPYTVYIPEQDMDDFEFMTTGEYGGIGAVISKHDSLVVVAEPYEGFPAQKTGLKAGDVFVEIDGVKIQGLKKVEEVSNLLKGTVGEEVKIKVSRFGEKKPLTFKVKREKIHVDAVPYYGMLNDEVGYVRLKSFTLNCGDDVKRAILELKEKHHAKKLVFDLRSNPGGLLIEAVKIANLFVNKGEEIVSTKGKVSTWDKVYKAPVAPLDTLMPLVVLVNRGSASASEIVTGAIQDLDRGVVIGNRTFGKGLVQTTRDLSYNSKLKVTTAKYYIPSGRCIQALDYSHRNDDGSVGTIPDSLITEFNTRGGRKVYDGGGITPDLEIKPEYFSSISINLIREFMIFDYATKFVAEHKEIPSVQDFEITDDIYNDFVSYVTKHDFTYESVSEKLLERVVAKAKKEKYYDLSKDDFDALKKKLAPNLEKDIKAFKPEICDLLKGELIVRYYYQKGQIKSALKDDIEIKKAKELLANMDEYKEYLEAGRVIKHED